MPEPTANQQLIAQILDAGRPHQSAKWECETPKEAENMRKRFYRMRDRKYREGNYEDVNLQVAVDGCVVTLRWIKVPGQLLDKDGKVIWQPPKQIEKSDSLADELAAMAQPVDDEDD